MLHALWLVVLVVGVPRASRTPTKKTSEQGDPLRCSASTWGHYGRPGALIAQKLTEAGSSPWWITRRRRHHHRVRHCRQSAAGRSHASPGRASSGDQSQLARELPYDAEKSFAPVTLLVFSPAVLVVHPSLSVNSVRELIALAKSRPGEINFASGGNASGAHLAGELLKRRAGINMVHVPYKGQAMVLPAVLSGQVPVTFIQLPTVRSLIAQGKLRALAVIGGARSPAMPDLPTIAEAAGLPGFKVNTWFGVVAPAGTPSRIVSRLNGEIGKIMHMPDVRELLVTQGAEPATGTPEEFAAFIRTEIATSAELVRVAGARVD